MNTKKEYTVLSPVSYNGDITKGGVISLPEDVAKRLLKMPEPPIADPDAEVVVSTSTDPVPVTLEHIVTAIGNLDPDDKSHWTKGNKPNATVLSEKLNHEVSAAVRDEAWLKFQGITPPKSE